MQAYEYNQRLEEEQNQPRLTRNPIHRDCEDAETRLMTDYFDDYFLPDATGRMSLSVIMKCTSAIRQLAYDNTPDAFDEYLQMSEHTKRNCLDNFNKCIIDLYMPKYLRKPTLHDIENVYARHEYVHGIPGMLESIDSGMNNDINVLDNSPLFDDLLDDIAPVAPYVIRLPFKNDEDDSPVEEVSLVKPKKLLRCATRAKKDEPKEPPKDCTMAEETALCQAWYFEKETGSSRGYDSIVSKWKNRCSAQNSAFCAIINNVEANHESGTNDLDVYHKAYAEYIMMYKSDFTLDHCYNILKDHLGWKDVEMPYFYKSQGRKKSKTSETTSGSASGGLNFNEEADEDVEETQEFRPMSRDRAKAKKKAVGSSRGGSSSFVDVDTKVGCT
ncbi:retrotransposon protein, putative, ty3-gypsy subclass [Tanacetum coccineum]|uniref:Retrotransposon protein, putative, ty3-gypsy subclass n=1 Tax=Tanacetum coccineum TaxID=301880 RepID=A0ABQ5GIH0_9ASTR